MGYDFSVFGEFFMCVFVFWDIMFVDFMFEYFENRDIVMIYVDFVL